jgi:methyl-accepting chemotaxis protein
MTMTEVSPHIAGNGPDQERASVMTAVEGLRGVLDALRTNVFVADRALNLVYANPRALVTLRRIEPDIVAAFGLSVDEILGGSIHRFHRDPARIDRILADPSALPRDASFAFGSVTLKTSINAVREGGEPVAFVVAWEDISEQQRNERELARIHAMVESSPSNMAYADAEGIIQYLNPAAMRTLSFLERNLPCRADDVVGRSTDILHGGAGRYVDAGRDDTVECQVTMGAETLQIVVSPIRDDGRRLVGTLTSWDVVTEKLRLETQTAELHERELEQAALLRSRVDEMLSVVNAAAQGDLTRSVGFEGDDAVGQMAAALNQFLGDLRLSIATIGQNSHTLAAAAEELQAVSTQMGDNAAATSSQAHAVQEASRGVSSHVETVSLGADEMNASIKEIARNATEAARVAGAAVEAAIAANRTVEKLGDSSAEIGKIIKVITGIAQQTNLLALNATIEAARAGEAGKGFAVVANEVKELAKETAKATEDISTKIETIQADTTGAVAAISEITSIIDQISDFQTKIAGAVEEQAATTSEIARSVTNAHRGSTEITENIAVVALATESTAHGVTESQRAATELARMAAELQGLIATFEF